MPSKKTKKHIPSKVKITIPVVVTEDGNWGAYGYGAARPWSMKDAARKFRDMEQDATEASGAIPWGGGDNRHHEIFHVQIVLPVPRRPKTPVIKDVKVTKKEKKS